MQVRRHISAEVIFELRAADGCTTGVRRASLLLERHTRVRRLIFNDSAECCCFAAMKHNTKDNIKKTKRKH